MKPKNQTANNNAVWRFFSSVRLTLAILIILAVVSIVGTLIPQRSGVEEFARGLSPGALEVFKALQLFDMYHSFWFRALISLLALNLIVCSLNRLGPTLRLFRAAPRPDRTAPFEGLPPENSFQTDLSSMEAASRAEEMLRKKHEKFERKDVGNDIFLVGERGRYSIFGVYIVHFSVILILLGAIIGSIWGFQGFVNIPEGEKVDTVRLRNSRAHKELGFQVECLNFDVQFYENGTPKEYRSDLRFVDDEVEEEAVLRVNHPFTFHGIRFYQSSYGSIPGDEVDLVIRRNDIEDSDAALLATRGAKMPLPEGEGHFVVEEIRGDFMRMGMGPAARISAHPDDGEPVSFWVFLNPDRARARFSQSFQAFPSLNPSAFEPYTFFLKGVESRYFTGLQVNKDPGVPYVWAGFFLLVGGLFVAFFMSHRTFRVRIQETGQGALLSVAGRSNKNPVGLERETRMLTDGLRKLLVEQESKS